MSWLVPPTPRDALALSTLSNHFVWYTVRSSCACSWTSLDSSKPAPKELKVSGSGSGTVGTKARSFFIDSTSSGSTSPAAMASFTALSRAT